MHKFFFISYLSPYKREFFVILCLMLIDSIVSLSIPYFIGQSTSFIMQDSALVHLNYSTILGVWISLLLIQSVARYQSSFKVNMLGANILASLNCNLFEHLQALPIDYFNKRKKGELVSLISNDSNVIAYFLSGILTGTMPSVIIALGAVLLMANISLSLALLISVSLPIFFMLIQALGRKIKPLSELITLQQASIVSFASENINTVKLVKSFNLEQAESHKFQKSADHMLDLRRSLFSVQAIISPLIQLLITIGIVVLLLISAMHYQSGELTLAQLVTLLGYGILFSKSIGNIAGVYGQLQHALGASTRIVDVFKVPTENSSVNSAELSINTGCVEFKNVSFSYDTKNTILKNISVRFKPNSINLILGENGSGKTTLCNLLMRFFDAKSGQILIDKQDITECSLVSLRQHIGLVSQNSPLIHGRVIDNITYGQKSTFVQAKKSAMAAGAHEFIEQLPMGYDTQIGDNGVLLSAGQRQRIALARALMLDSKIIIFDEPTSFADSFAKQSFVDLIQHKLKQHTVLVISHDLSLVEVAHYAYHLKDGELQSIKKPH